MTDVRVAVEYAAFARSLMRTRDVPERLVRLGYATAGDDGEIALREDVREPYELLEARIRAALDAGKSPREAAEASAIDAAPNATNVIYAIFLRGELACVHGEAAAEKLYVGETTETVSKRFARHPAGCPKLRAWIAKTGGKDGWECVVLLVLPEDARAKELLLYLEGRLQRILDTVEGPHALNCQYGAEKYGGAQDEERWLAKYVELIEFVSEHGMTPSSHAKDANVRSLGQWVNDQRRRDKNMSTHRRKALEAIGSAWQWKIKAPFVTNAMLFEKLRADERVIASDGVEIPMDIVCSAQRITDARKYYANGRMSEFDRAIVLMDFPGIAISEFDANFWINVKKFAEAYPKAERLPSHSDDPSMYKWLYNLQYGTIDVKTPWREEVLESFGLSKLLDTLLPAEVRDANRSRINAVVPQRRAVQTKMRTEARDTKKRKMLDDLVAGPPPSEF